MSNKIEENKKQFNDEAICGVLINEKKQILLAKRTVKRTYSPNLYDLMGGDIIPGEKPIETLFRDAKEKFGIQLDGEITELKEPIDMDYPNKTIKTHIFICQLNSNIPVQLDLKKYAECDWLYPAQIQGLQLAPKVKDVLIVAGLLK
jgi:mutator protein MutT